MNTSNNRNLIFYIMFFAASVISYLREETVALISSLGMALIFFLVYMNFRTMQRKLDI